MYKIVFIIHISLFLILNVIHLDEKVDVGSAFTLSLLSIFESMLLQSILRLFQYQHVTEGNRPASGNDVEDLS